MLLDLPREILTLIVQQACVGPDWTCTQQRYKALGRVCRTFGALVTPLLYHTIHVLDEGNLPVDKRDNWPSNRPRPERHRYDSAKDPRHFDRFVAYFRTNPQKAALTRVLDIEYGKNAEQDDETEEPDDLATMLMVPFQYIVVLRLAFDAIPCVLPGLPEGFALPHLHEFYLSSGYFKHMCTDVQDLQVFWTQPKLRDFHVLGLDIDSDTGDLSTVALPVLERTSFISCFMDPNVFETLMKMRKTKHLSLVYTSFEWDEVFAALPEDLESLRFTDRDDLLPWPQLHRLKYLTRFHCDTTSFSLWRGDVAEHLEQYKDDVPWSAEGQVRLIEAGSILPALTHFVLSFDRTWNIQEAGPGGESSFYMTEIRGIAPHLRSVTLQFLHWENTYEKMPTDERKEVVAFKKSGKAIGVEVRLEEFDLSHDSEHFYKSTRSPEGHS